MWEIIQQQRRDGQICTARRTPTGGLEIHRVQLPFWGWDFEIDSPE